MKHIHPHSIAARNALFLTAMLLATAINALATETDLTLRRQANPFFNATHGRGVAGKTVPT